MITLQQTAPVQVICDLRQSRIDIANRGHMYALWPEISKQLLHRAIQPGKPLDVVLPTGKVMIWVVNSYGVTYIDANTRFSIVDVLRAPQLLYTCQICGLYGPFRCVTCVNDPDVAEGQERRCFKHAYFIEDQLSAYCERHIPLCRCSPSCKHQAIFSCARCHRFFGEHVRYHHPNNSEVDYCNHCYSLLFNQCVTCKSLHCSVVGKLRCSFQTLSHPHVCNVALCWQHGQQWKVWGPHRRGITFCEHHQQQLSRSPAVDLLLMLLAAQPPRRGRSISLTSNIFRLRRIINKNRAAPISFEEIGFALQSLEPLVSSWHRSAQHRYQEMLKNYRTTIADLPQRGQDLLFKIKAFYEQILDRDAAQRVIDLNIIDRFFIPGQAPSFHIELYLNTSDKRPYIGRNGDTINTLRQKYNLKIDLWDISSGQAVPFARKKRDASSTQQNS